MQSDGEPAVDIHRSSSSSSDCNSLCTHTCPLIHPLVREYNMGPIHFDYSKSVYPLVDCLKIYFSTVSLGLLLGLRSAVKQDKAVHYPKGICGKGILEIASNAKNFFGLPKSRESIKMRHTYNMFENHTLAKGPRSLSISSELMDFTMLSGEVCPFWDVWSFLDFIKFQKTRSSDCLARQPCLWNSALCVAPSKSYMDCNYYSMVTYDYQNFLIRFRALPYSRIQSVPKIAFKELCFASFYDPNDAKLPYDYLNQEYKQLSRRTYTIQYSKINKSKLCPVEILHRRNASVPWFDQHWENFGTMEVTKVYKDRGNLHFTNKLPTGMYLKEPESLQDPACVGWMRSIIYPWMNYFR